jgi:hypothetical protein
MPHHTAHVASSLHRMSRRLSSLVAVAARVETGRRRAHSVITETLDNVPGLRRKLEKLFEDTMGKEPPVSGREVHVTSESPSGSDAASDDIILSPTNLGRQIAALQVTCLDAA